MLLTNAAGGSALRKELTPWVLEHFLGLREPPRQVIVVTDNALAEYTGTFGVRDLLRDIRLVRAEHGLAMQRYVPGRALDPTAYDVRFYASDRATIVGGDEDTHLLDFLRSDDGQVRWLRHNGRVVERVC